MAAEAVGRAGENERVKRHFRKEKAPDPEARRDIAKPGGLADRLLAIGRSCGPRIKGRLSDIQHGDLLYDERGLPR